MSTPSQSIRAMLRSDSDVVKVHKVRPLCRTFVATRITERNIHKIAGYLGETAYKDLSGNSRMSDGDSSVPTGWWVVWYSNSPQDYHLYSNDDFNKLYVERGGAAAEKKWPTEPLIILLDASSESVTVNCPEVAMRTSNGGYMLPGGDILGENNSVIRDYKPATVLRLDDAATLLTKKSEGTPRPAGQFASEA